MKPRNWAKYIWIALAVLEALAMLADLIGGQDPYRHQVMMMLALLFDSVNDLKEEQQWKKRYSTSLRI